MLFAHGITPLNVGAELPTGFLLVVVGVCLVFAGLVAVMRSK